MILVVGAGHLGKYLVEHISGAVLTQLRLAEVRSIRGLEAIINAAGKTDLAWCEANKKAAVQANVTDAVALRARAAACGVPFIQLSSGCIWDGPYRPDGKPFGPTDPASPASFYADTKAAADTKMLALVANGAPVACLRLRMPFSGLLSGRNLLTKLCGYETLIDDPQSITSVETLLATVEALLADEDCPLWNRPVCVYDRGTVSPFRIGAMLAEAGLRKQPKLLVKSDLDTWHRPKRVSTVMSDPEFERVVQPGKVEPALVRAITEYAAAAAAATHRTASV